MQLYHTQFTQLIAIDPETLGGQPVFKETHFPVEILFDYLEAGIPLEEFLDDFPTISKEQDIALLQIANKFLTAKNVAKLYEAAA